MGTKMAPAYAKIFMSTLESRILSETKPSPTHWKRYIDDIFLVWTDTKESLEQFIKSINGLHECSLQNFQQLKSRSWTYACTKGRDLLRKAFWISKPISRSLTPNSIYMPHPPTLPEQAGVSSRENYSDTFEQTQMKLRSRCTKRSMSKT